MTKPNNILLRALGLLLLVAAILKGAQLLTEPVAAGDIWSSRPFLIFQVEFELALAIWLLSGLFNKAAWFTVLLCFSLFSFVTLCKGLTGAASCGCFGSVQVNPWMTLLVVDIPAVIALAVFRPRRHSERSVAQSKNLLVLLQSLFTPLPSIPHFTTTVSVSLVILVVTGSVLAFNEPAKVTGGYEVLEPGEWVGKKLSILKDIDIGKQLAKGTWLVLFYHYDCPDCVTAIRKYQRAAADNELRTTNYELKMAFIEVPPYGRSVVGNNPDYAVGKLLDIKEWFVTTPAVVLLDDSMVRNSWEESAPDLDAVLNSFAKLNKSSTSRTGPERR